MEDNELVLIDCPATSYQKVKKMNWERYDNIYILVTHTHGDHSGGVGTMLQYVWFASYMKKKVTIVAPSAEVKEDLLLLLMRISLRHRYKASSFQVIDIEQNFRYNKKIFALTVILVVWFSSISLKGRLML